MKTQNLFSAGWSEVTSGERNEIVFERLNRTYGAYEIRTNYDFTLVKAFAATALLMGLLSASLFLSAALTSGKVILPPDPGILPPPPKPYITITDPPVIPSFPKPRVNTNQLLAPDVTNDSIMANEDTTLSLSGVQGSDGPGVDTTGADSPISGTITQTITEPGNPEPFDGLFVQEPPTFPGGDEALFAFLKSNIVYPQDIRDIGGGGLAAISFILDEEGNVIEASILKKTRFAQLDNEALRVVRKLPRWNPGRQQGRAVKVRMCLPVRFELKQ